MLADDIKRFVQIYKESSCGKLSDSGSIKKIDYWEVYEMLTNAGFKVKNPMDKSIELIKPLLIT